MAEHKIYFLFRKWDTSQIEIKDLGLQQRVLVTKLSHQFH